MTIIVSIERLKRFKVVPIVATRNCTMKICLPTHTCQFRLKGFHEGEDRSCIPNVILSSFTIGNGELSLSTNLSSQLFQLLTSPRYLSRVGSSSEDNFSSQHLVVANVQSLANSKRTRIARPTVCWNVLETVSDSKSRGNCQSILKDQNQLHSPCFCKQNADFRFLFSRLESSRAN